MTSGTSNIPSAALWPLNSSHAVGELSTRWRRRLRHSSACQFCDKTIDVINEKWNEDMKKPLAGWQDLQSFEGPGIGEDIFLSFYDEHGLDEDAYDKDGYNEDGEHYIDLYEDWQGISDPLSGVAARRQILEGLLKQIPRYAALQRTH